MSFAEGQVAIRTQVKITLQRGQAAGAIHPQPFFRGDHENLIGVHATEIFDVDRKAGWRARAGLCNRGQCAVENLIGSGQRIEILRPHFAFDYQTARDEIELFNVRCGQTARSNPDFTLAYIETGERTITVERRP